MTLTKRQQQIAGFVAKGYTGKQIAETTGLSVRTVEGYVARAADRIPGERSPRHKLTLWFLSTSDDGDSA